MPPDLASILLSGMNSGGNQFSQAAGLAMAAHQQRLEQEEMERQLAQQAVDQRANVSRFQSLRGQPLFTLPGQSYNLPNPHFAQDQQRQDSYGQGLATVTESIRSAAGGIPGGVPPEVGAGLQMLQGAIPAPQPEMFQGRTSDQQHQNADYLPPEQLDVEAAAFAQASPGAQQHWLGALETSNRQMRMEGYKRGLEQQEFEKDMAMAESIKKLGYSHTPQGGVWSPTLARIYEKWNIAPEPALTAGIVEQYQNRDPAGIAGVYNATGGFLPSSAMPSAMGEVTPEILAGLQSQDPATRHQAAALYMQTTGRAPPMGMMAKPQNLPPERAVQAVRDMYGDDTAEVYATTGKIVRPKGGDILVDPLERAGKFAEIVDGYGGERAFNPGALTALEDKFIRDHRITDADWKRALVDTAAARKGSVKAAEVEFYDFRDKLKMARQDLAAAKKAGAKPKALEPLERRVQQLEVIKASALSRFTSKLAGDDGADDIPPMVPAAGPTQDPAAGVQVSLIDQIIAEMPGATDEQIAAEYKRRSVPR
jgi:hypothetical protein